MFFYPLRLLRLHKRYHIIMNTMVILLHRVIRYVITWTSCDHHVTNSAHTSVVLLLFGVTFYFFAIIGMESFRGKVFVGCWWVVTNIFLLLHLLLLHLLLLLFSSSSSFIYLLLLSPLLCLLLLFNIPELLICFSVNKPCMMSVHTIMEQWTRPMFTGWTILMIFFIAMVSRE